MKRRNSILHILFKPIRKKTKRSKYLYWQTRNSKISQALRQLWLRSKERSEALKRAKYCCEECGVKQSKAKGKEVKVEVHHKDLPEGINWSEICAVIRKALLPSPDRLQVLCEFCHHKKHKKESENE